MLALSTAATQLPSSACLKWRRRLTHRRADTAAAPRDASRCSTRDSWSCSLSVILLLSSSQVSQLLPQRHDCGPCSCTGLLSLRVHICELRDYWGSCAHVAVLSSKLARTGRCENWRPEAGSLPRASAWWRCWYRRSKNGVCCTPAHTPS